MVIWIGFLGTAQLQKIVPGHRTFGSSCFRMVIWIGLLVSRCSRMVIWTFGSRAAPKDSSRAAIWIGLLGANVSGW